MTFATMRWVIGGLLVAGCGEAAHAQSEAKYGTQCFDESGGARVCGDPPEEQRPPVVTPDYKRE